MLKTYVTVLYDSARAVQTCNEHEQKPMRSAVTVDTFTLPATVKVSIRRRHQHVMASAWKSITMRRRWKARKPKAANSQSTS